jgi:hypothetical protein
MAVGSRACSRINVAARPVRWNTREAAEAIRRSGLDDGRAPAMIAAFAARALGLMVIQRSLQRRRTRLHDCGIALPLRTGRIRRTGSVRTSRASFTFQAGAQLVSQPPAPRFARNGDMPVMSKAYTLQATGPSQSLTRNLFPDEHKRHTKTAHQGARRLISFCDMRQLRASDGEGHQNAEPRGRGTSRRAPNHDPCQYIRGQGAMAASVLSIKQSSGCRPTTFRSCDRRRGRTRSSDLH